MAAKTMAATLRSASNTARNRDCSSLAIGIAAWLVRGPRSSEDANPFSVCNLDATMGAILKTRNPWPMNSFQNYKLTRKWEICFLEYSCEISNRWKLLRWRYLQGRNRA